ncbi:signal peptidase II [Criblamydia sequanensis]|uniref:Lipoprotein signal peptidase n=1 Tax=Candidatus Criblamydia sequanensis CRIB-18 TaxID=1437425 RepID=A0A090D272_9BACT|nr:signal peptidase II [Criblamydia sequanensis]CDR34385.1 Lipoprotein signal peptidase [Criblamydia sequanensis CRIB-18]
MKNSLTSLRLLKNRNFLFSLSLFAGVLFFDQWLKYVVQNKLPKMCFFCSYPYGGFGVFKNFLGVQFSIVHTANKGAAWSLFSEYQEVLLLFRIALILFLIFYACRFSFGKTLFFPYALLIGGAIANIIDYFTYGHVIDMFYFVFWGYSYPVFNIADTAIFISVAWMAMAYLFELKNGQIERKAVK